MAARQPGQQTASWPESRRSAKKSEQPIKRTEESLMASITAVANDFFAACETGKGWEVCKTYCTPNATFAAQAEPLAEIKTLAEYADWMKGLMTIMPDGSYEVKSFATDVERNNVAAYAVFSGTHTGPGGPCEPTGKKTTSDYVYVMNSLATRSAT
jgi:predicted ester cyclase